MIPNLLLNESVYQEIKTKIINDEYRSGERIDINMLSAEFGVSRTPIINALKALAKDGYVIIKQRTGSYVRDYTREELEALYDFRVAAECLVLKLAIHLVDEDKVKAFLDKFMEKRRSLDDGSGIEQFFNFFDEQLGFHQYLVSLCPQIIANEVKNLIDLTQRTGKLQLKHMLNDVIRKRGIDKLKNEVDIHIHLAKAVLDQDLKKALQVIQNDHANTKNYIIEHFDEINVPGKPV